MAVMFVRVEDKETGHQYDVREDAVLPDLHRVLKDYPANDTEVGRPAKFRTDKAGQSATKTKE